MTKKKLKREKQIIRRGNVLVDLEGKALSVCTVCGKFFRDPKFDIVGETPRHFCVTNLCPRCEEWEHEKYVRKEKTRDIYEKLADLYEQVQWLNNKMNLTITALALKVKEYQENEPKEKSKSKRTD